ncbi:MAG: hypothetical protein QOE60_2623 [Thermoleophilaceae bacterium]|nr:hypothetical protein [Thermoleophilaceae bacterium]
MIYEYRHYSIVPGKQPAVHQRFEESLVELFKKHNIDVVAFFQPVVGSILNDLHYIVRWDNVQQMHDTWNTFYTDPEFIEVAVASEANGPLVDKANTEIWVTTPYSPTL